MISLCHLCELDATQAKGPLSIQWQGRAERAFVVRYRGRIYAYIDRCPHAGAPLEMEPDRYFDLTGHYILCTLHAAHFNPTDGVCVAGPCQNRRLTALPIRVEDGQVWIS